MSERILSEDELKALFSAASSLKNVPMDNKGRQKEVRVYDFRQPRLFIQEHTRTLENIYKDFSSALSSVLAVYLNLPVQIVFASIKEQTYGEFINSIPKPTLLNFLKMDPTGKYSVVELNNELAHALVDRILGGTGKSSQTRALTEIELGLISKIVKKIVDSMNFSWKRKVERLNFALDSMVTVPEQAPISVVEMEHDKVFTVRFELKAGLTLGEMNVCILHAALKPFLADLGIRLNKGVKPGSITQENLMDLDIGVKVGMGDVELTFGDFIKLQKGDVIPILPTDRNMIARVGEEFDLHCRLGRVKNKKAVQVVPKVLPH